MRRIHRFTLIEILVVIAIIGILAGLLFPMLGRARASAKKTECLNSKRNLAQAALSYANDFDKLILLTGSKDTPYSWALSGHSMDQSTSETDVEKNVPTSKIYLGIKAMRCPITQTMVTDDLDHPEEKVAGIFDTGKSDSSWWSKNATGSSISMTKRFGEFREDKKDGTVCYSIRKMKATSQFILFADTIKLNGEKTSALDAYHKFCFDGNDKSVGRIALLHLNETTVGYADGHADSMEKGKLQDGPCALDGFLDEKFKELK